MGQKESWHRSHALREGSATSLQKWFPGEDAGAEQEEGLELGRLCAMATSEYRSGSGLCRALQVRAGSSPHQRGRSLRERATALLPVSACRLCVQSQRTRSQVAQLGRLSNTRVGSSSFGRDGYLARRRYSCCMPPAFWTRV